MLDLKSSAGQENHSNTDNGQVTGPELNKSPAISSPKNGGIAKNLLPGPVSGSMPIVNSPNRFGFGPQLLTKMKQAVLLFPLIAGLIMGCSAVGTGKRTVILHESSTHLATEQFPHLAIQTENLADRVRIFDGDSQPTYLSRYPWKQSSVYKDYKKYLRNKYGKEDVQPAKLSFNTSDLAAIPIHLPELALENLMAINKITADNELSKEQRIERTESLKYALHNIPHTQNTTILKGYDNCGRGIYHYFPRIQIDFSADLLSSSNLDRFSQLAMLIRIPKADFEKGVRFLDFSPKGADILEFTRGELKQESQLMAKATAGTDTTTGPATEPVSKIAKLGGELSYTATETFTRELKDAIEKRTIGIIENGRGFLVQLRAIKEIRIGGTYTFEVALEVPSKPTDDYGEKSIRIMCRDKEGKKYEQKEKVTKKYKAEPVITKGKDGKIKLVADILLVGVVRHVHDRGMTGWFNRVPETENDDVYEQVIIKEDKRLIWTFDGIPWKRPHTPVKVKTFTAKVITNREDARFAVFDKNDNILASGNGEEAEFSIPNDDNQVANAKLIFFPVIYTPTQGNPTNLMPVPAKIEFTGKDINKTFTTIYTAP